MTTKRILVTGAAGFVGSQLLQRLAGQPELFEVTGTDVRAPKEGAPSGVNFAAFDIRDRVRLEALVVQTRPDCIIHLASIVTPPPGMDRRAMWDIDVGATQALLELVVAHGVPHVVITTSGASYGYHPDNPAWLRETDAIRGNQQFAYSDHKRQIEEAVAAFRHKHPATGVLVLRPGTVLGKTVNNQITALFKKKRLLALRGYPSPFVFIWDQDLVEILRLAALEAKVGVFNVAGDGALPMTEIAQLLGKPLLQLPAGAVAAALAVLHPLGLSQYGPEQTMFLKYRPVLANEALKTGFPYVPRMTSREAFLALLEAQPELRNG